VEQGLTLGAQEVVALVGVHDSFGKAGSVLEKTTGLLMSESTVQRNTEAAGEMVGELLEAGEVFGPAQSFEWNCDAMGKSCAYISLDMTGIMMQGPDGAKAEGRIVDVAMIFLRIPRIVWITWSACAIQAVKTRCSPDAYRCLNGNSFSTTAGNW
jgi:hypothetical protein